MDMISIASPNRFFYGFFSTFLQHQGSAVSSFLLEDVISLEDAIAKTKISGPLAKIQALAKSLRAVSVVTSDNPSFWFGRKLQVDWTIQPGHKMLESQMGFVWTPSFLFKNDDLGNQTSLRVNKSFDELLTNCLDPAQRNHYVLKAERSLLILFTQLFVR